ncbi:MAG TPA: ammonium transporter, partial [Actinomycetota bacterium]|nr:ammonium transporter [Actinomycetota bacterium]
MAKVTRILLVLSMAFVAWLAVGGIGHASTLPQACGGKITGAGDPCGDTTGTAVDITGNPNPTLEEVADQVGKNKIGLNFTWTLFAGFLVMFMQAGFALVETGFCRRKNAAHVIMTNFMIYGIGILGFFIVGYALMFGGVGHVANLGGTAPLTGEATVGGWGIFGYKGFGMSGIYDVGVMTHFLFNLVFMDTTATIVTGAMAERWKFSAFVVYGFFVSMIVYPVFGNWAWGGGWLAQLGSK